MNSLVKDPIKRKIFFLVVLLIIVALSIVGSKMFMENIINLYGKQTRNTDSLLYLNQIIYRHFMLIRSDFDLLISAINSREDTSELEESIELSFNDIRIVLNTIEYGGSYDYNYFDKLSIYTPSTKLMALHQK